MATKGTKAVRRLERPRPLRLDSDSDTCGELREQEIITELERLHVSMNNGNFDKNVSSRISTVCAMLMAKGAAIDASKKEILDYYFVTLKNAAHDGRLDACSRMKLAQVVQLRSMQWECNENVRHFYQRMIQQLEEESQLGVTYDTPSSTPSSTSSPPRVSHGTSFVQQRRTARLRSSMVPASSPSLSPQPPEVLQSSGNVAKPAAIPGQNVLEDEVVNSSGKVVPGVRDRTVRSTGPDAEAMQRGPELVGDILRRNASPVGEVGRETAAAGYAGAAGTSQEPPLVHSGGTGDASIAEFSSALSVGRDTVRITGSNRGLVGLCKLVLEGYFAGEMEFRDGVAAELPAQPKDYAANESSEPIICGTGGPRLNLSGIDDRPSSQTSSSSDETLMEEDGCQKPETVVAAQSPKQVTKSASIAKNQAGQVAAETSVPLGAPAERSERIEKSGSASVFSAESEPPQVPSSSVAGPPTSSPCRRYSRDVLFHLSRSPLSLQLPLDFPRLDPAVEKVLVKKDRRWSHAD